MCMSVYRFKLVGVRLSDSYDLEKNIFSVVLYGSPIKYSQLSSHPTTHFWRTVRNVGI